MGWLSLAAPQIDLPGGEQAVLIVLRWIHLVAGITWIGLLYFFNLVNMPFLQELDAKQRGLVIPQLMPQGDVVVSLEFAWSPCWRASAYWNTSSATDAQ